MAKCRTGGESLKRGLAERGVVGPEGGSGTILSSPLNEGGAVFEREKRVLAGHYRHDGVSMAEVAQRVGIGRRTTWSAGVGDRPEYRRLWPSKVVHLGRVIEARSRRWIEGFLGLTGPCSIPAFPFSTGGAMIGREKRVLLRHYLEPGHDEGGDRPGCGGESRQDISLDRQLDN